MNTWIRTVHELIVRASTDLPADVEAALRRAAAAEAPESNAARAFAIMLRNVELARATRQPLCQDTGSLLFWVEAPSAVSQRTFMQAAEAAIVRATDEGILRRNCVETLSGRNTGNNLGAGSPQVHWHETGGDTVRVSLLLKGGGCENVGAQYSLPDAGLGADRDVEGVRRCILDAVHRAQGLGCAPGVLGVAIGGDRASGYVESKRLFLRRIGERSPVPELAAVETRVCREANELGIGPMGFGGRTAVLEVFIGSLARLPASYFVTVSNMCWSYRRQSVCTAGDGTLVD